MYLPNTLKYGVFFTVGAAIVALIAIGIDEGIKSLDSMLIPCQHGTTYTSSGSCSCIDTPFIGKYCGICNCSNGYCVIGGTNPRITSDYGCKCPSNSKFFGFLCDQCFAVNKTYTTNLLNPQLNGCTGDCEEGFFGTRCSRTCFANISHYDTLDANTTGNETICRTIRTNGGVCEACSGHGTCHDGFCKCDKHYFDNGMAKCSLTCPESPDGEKCSGHGVCKLFGSTPGCLCEPGWRGEVCDIPCPGLTDSGKPCNGNGNCMIDYAEDPPSTTCDCRNKFIGSACEYECPGDGDACTGHGTCMVQNNKATCICQTGMLDWVGTGCNCTDLLSCNGHGSCVADPYMEVSSDEPSLELSLTEQECQTYAIDKGLTWKGIASLNYITLNPSVKQLGLCEGDCDTDNDCHEGMYCYQRSGMGKVPGCTGTVTYNIDYCLYPFMTLDTDIPVTDYSGAPTNLNACEGDCDVDTDCQGGMYCFQRSGENTPGCKGETHGWDYCIQPVVSTLPVGCSVTPDGYVYFKDSFDAQYKPDCGVNNVNCIQNAPVGVGQCLCEGNYDGKNCLKCKPNYWGSECQFYCDEEADHDDDPNKLGCHGRGSCTILNMDTVFEEVVCACNNVELRLRINGRMTNFFSAYDSDINCKDCFTGYFPKLDIFNQYDTIPEGLYVPCQVPCVPSTCNNQGTCNELYGKPGETLCTCSTGANGYKHVNESTFCTECDTNWFPDRVEEEEGCTNFCIADLTDVGGEFPAICDEGDIDCIHCNGVGSCTVDGTCECEEGYTGDFCQMQCTSPNGVICGGHGVCESNDLQLLLQFEMAYIEESGPLFQCTCDPQDTFTKEARQEMQAEGTDIEPRPEPTYFGETCDYHCLKPPWEGSDECNGLGNCTSFTIRDPNDEEFECFNDEDCTSTDIIRILSGDVNWHSKKGPFCKKYDYPDKCFNDTYHVDDCLDILTLQRPTVARHEKCVENTQCRHTLERHDWHNWCTNMQTVSSPSTFQSCGEIIQFCPASNIDSKCSDYVSLYSKFHDVSSGQNDNSVSESECQAYAEATDGLTWINAGGHGHFHSGCSVYAANGNVYFNTQNTAHNCGVAGHNCIQRAPISAHMDYCYESDKKKYPFSQNAEYRLTDESAELRDTVDDQMMQYHEEFPTVNIDITDYCNDHMIKFQTVISEVNQNKRFQCGSSISHLDTCVYGGVEITDNWKPFSTHCPNGESTTYRTLEEAVLSRQESCIVTEDESRQIVVNAGNIAYGGTCYGNSDCAQGFCNGNSCCVSDIEFCSNCNTLGQCTACEAGTTWNGIKCAGTPTFTLLTGTKQKEGIDIIDNTCSSISSVFPQCFEPTNACEIDACKDGDTCTPKGADGICETQGILDCTCKYGLQCVPLSFTTYKCVGNFVVSDCPKEYKNFNWAGYCQSNNPVLKQETFGSNLLELNDPHEIVEVSSGTPNLSLSEAECQQYGEGIGQWGGVVSFTGEIKGCYYITDPNISPKVWFNTDSTSVADCSLASRSCIQKRKPVITLTGIEQSTEYIHYWVQPTTIYSSSKYVEIVNNEISKVTSGTPDLSMSYNDCKYYADSNWDEDSFTHSERPSGCFLHTSSGKYYYNTQTTNVVCSTLYPCIEKSNWIIARIYMHQGQIQLNEIAALESCPKTNPTCFEDWSYQSNKWYHLELSIDYLYKKVSLVNLANPLKSLVKDFDCVADGCHSIQSITEVTFTGDTTTYFDQIVFEKDIPNPSLYTACDSYPYCDVDVNYRNKCSDIIRNVQYPLLLEPSHDIVDTCKNFFEYQSFDTYILTFLQQDAIQKLDWDTYCLFYDSITENQYNCGSHGFEYFENYTNCRDLLEPLDGSKQCMQDSLTYDWNQYCFDLDLASVPSSIKNNCPKACYKKFRSYDGCDARMAMFSSNMELKDSNCPDKWVPYCKSVSMDRHKGVCSGVECECDAERFEGTSGASCELHCLIASDGTPCGEGLGVGKCVPNDNDQRMIDNGVINDNGDLIAFDKPQSELRGVCNCFVTEGTRNCDQECFRCNENAYKEVDASGTYIFTTEHKILDMHEDDIISGLSTSSYEPFNVSISMDGIYYEPIDIGDPIATTITQGYIITGGPGVKPQRTITHTIHCKAYADQICPDGCFTYIGYSTTETSGCSYANNWVYYNKNTDTSKDCDDNRKCVELGDVETNVYQLRAFGRFVKVVPPIHFQLKITRAGQIGMCNGATGVCDCLPPFTLIIEEKYTNWRGQHRKRIKRIHNLPEEYNAVEEFRIRAMQGKEVFTKQYLRKQDNSLAYTGGQQWRPLYYDFRDNPGDYKCMPDRSCTKHDFILLGNLDGSSSRYNYDCSTQCEGTDADTLIPCTGHGSCAVTGKCICDPAALVKGTNEVTGYSQVFKIGDLNIERSEYIVSKFDKSGWRGSDCSIMCPGYNQETKSMLNVCGGRGVCNIDGECECELGYTGSYCQFTCPGFDEGEENVCSGHGTCILNLIEVVGMDNGAIVDPIDCVGTWSAWSTCDGERQERIFTTTVLPLYGGQACPITPEYRGCFLPNTDCDGTWSTWSACDGNHIERSFTITTQPVRYGIQCPLSPQKYVCSLPKVDCDGSWGSWSTCMAYYIADGSDDLCDAWDESVPRDDCINAASQLGLSYTYTSLYETGSHAHTGCFVDGTRLYYFDNEHKEDNYQNPTTYRGRQYLCKRSQSRQQRSFSVDVQPANLGLSCPLSPQIIDCTGAEQHCIYTANAWGECDKGIRTKTYNVITAPSGGGMDCPTPITKSCTSCSGNDKCDSNVCLGGKCCTKNHYLCSSCNEDGLCQSCATHASFKIDGKCACDSGYMENNGECIVIARRLRSSRIFPKLKLKTSNLLPSCNTDADCTSPDTNGKCKGGICCHKDYTDTTNCRQCNDGQGVWRYEVRDGYLAGGPNASLYCSDYSLDCPSLVASIGCSTTDDRVSGCKKSCAGQTGFPACDANLNFVKAYGYEYAVYQCDLFGDQCKGIYSIRDSNQWFLRDETQVVADANYITYRKIYESNDFCAACIEGASYFRDRKKCKGLACPVGQTFVEGQGCKTITGEADTKMQIPVQTALEAALCEPGFYTDTVSGICKPVQEHPMIDVTLFIDKDTPDEISMTFNCEVWGSNVVKCPQCSCFFDYIYGKWSSFECETCLKGFGQKQCRKRCPGFDGEEDITMCSGYGTCAFGSMLDPTTNLRSFQDATCTCGNPPGSLSENKRNMNIYNTFYTELTTITELTNVVDCQSESVLEEEMVDTCYHFDMSLASCNACEEGWSGSNCKYKCEKCLAGGRCSSVPSDKENSQCECPSDLSAGLWSYNCCPIGFMVAEIDRFNEIPQETDDTSFSIDDIGLNSIFNPSVHDDTTFSGYDMAKRSADYWCEACPGVDLTNWLSPQALFQSCGGVDRGECYRNKLTTPYSIACSCFVGNGNVYVTSSDGTIVPDTYYDYSGEACRCRPQDNRPFINLQQDYGCFNQGACLNKVQYLEIDDVKNPGIVVRVAVACSPNAGHYTRMSQTVDPMTGDTIRNVEVIPAHRGTHVPFNNFLYLTDESGDALNYIDLDTNGNIAASVIKPYLHQTVLQGVEVIGLRCNNGYYQDERGKATCKECPSGKFTPGVWNHIENSDKFGFNLSVPQWETLEAYSQCYDCPPGRSTHGLAGQPQCTNCKGGYYQNEAGQSECKACPIGKITITTDNTDMDGVHRATGYNECTTCPIHTQPQNVNALGMDNYVSTAGSVCVDCNRGSDNYDGAQCEWCAAGYWRDGYRDYVGCQACGISLYSSAAHSLDVNQGPGKTIIDATDGTVYLGTDAPLGTTPYPEEDGGTLVGSWACRYCPSGRYNDETGQPRCKSCPGGQYTDRNPNVQPRCDNCPDGTYMLHSSNKGVLVDVSRDSESDCTSCGKGKRGKGEGKATEALGCEWCPEGKFQNWYGQADCKNCAAAKWSSLGRTSACTDNCDEGHYCLGDGLKRGCAAGKYNDETGQTECKDCKAGKYQGQTGKDFCQGCPDNTGTKNLGATSSSACEACTPYYRGTSARDDQPDPGCPSCGGQTWTVHKNPKVGTDFHGNSCPATTTTSGSRYCGHCGWSTCKHDCSGDPCSCYKWRTYPDHSSCSGWQCLHTCSWQGRWNTCGWRL